MANNLSDKILIGGKCYTLYAESDSDADKFIHDRVIEITTPLVNEFVQQANSMATLEHNRIMQEVNRQYVAIPPELNLLPVISINGKAVQLRNLVYSPTRISGMKMNWLEQLGDDSTIIDDIEIWDSLRNDDVIECIGKSKYAMAMMVAKLPTNIITSRQIYHSMSVYAQNPVIKWHDMCIGNATPEIYWNVPFNDFVSNINSINLDSLGKHEIFFGDVPLHIERYIGELTYKVYTKRARGGAWTTEQR